MPQRDDRSIEVQAVAATFLATAGVAVLLRCYTRLRLVKGFGQDDWAMVVAMLLYLVFGGTTLGSTLYGTGRHFRDLTAHQRMTGMMYWWIAEITYCFASVICKVSVIIFLKRITIRQVHNWILNSVMGLNIVAGLIFMFTLLLQCKPIDYFWKKAIFDPAITGRCNIDMVVIMIYIYSAFAALSDFTVGLLPIFIVKDLRMKMRTKVAVSGILGMACIASCGVLIRMAYIQTFRDPDFLYATVDIAIWSNTETGLGITAGSLATLRPLLKKWIKSHTDPYSSRGFPSRSLRLGLRGTDPERQLPLSSLDGNIVGHSKTATVTELQTQPEIETDRFRGSTGSQGESQGELIDRQSSSWDHEPRGLEIMVHRTIEVARMPGSAVV